MRSLGTAFLLFLAAVSVSTEPKSTQNAANIVSLMKSVLNDCTVCNFLKDFHEKAPVYEKLEEKMVSMCKEVPATYTTMCEKVSSKAAQRVGAYVTEKLSATDCSTVCSAPSHVFTTEALCAHARPLMDDMDHHFATILTDATEFCKTEKNPFDCLRQLNEKTEMGKNLAERMYLRVLHAIDSEKQCGVDLSTIPQGESVIKGEQDDALPMKCSLCFSLTTFLFDAMHMGAIVNTLAGILVKVCNLIGLGADQCNIDNMAGILSILSSLFEPNTNTGGSSFCQMIYKECPGA